MIYVGVVLGLLGVAASGGAGPWPGVCSVCVAYLLGLCIGHYARSERT